MAKRKMKMTVTYEMKGNTDIMVPDDLTLEEAINYAKKNVNGSEYLKEVDVPKKPVRVLGSFKIIEETCNFEKREVTSLAELYTYIKVRKKEFKDLETDCECFGNNVVMDNEWTKFLREIGVDLVNSDYYPPTSRPARIKDDEIMLFIPSIKVLREDGSGEFVTLICLDDMKLREEMSQIIQKYC